MYSNEKTLNISQFFIIALLILTNLILSSCAQKNHNINDNVIAHNFDHSIKLTEDQLIKWKQSYNEIRYLDRKGQIESYFLNKALLFDMENQLNTLEIKELNFLHEQKYYAKAKNMVRDRFIQQVVPNSKQVKILFEKYKIFNNDKKDKSRLYQIFKRYPPNSSNKDKQNIVENMDAIRGQITSLKEFKIWATKESDSQTRLKGGLIGNVKKDHFNSELDKIVMQLRPNEMSEVIKGNNGVMLFYCEKIIKANIKPENEVYKNAINETHKQQSSLEWNNYITDRLNSLNIKYNWDSWFNDSSENSSIASTSNDAISRQEIEWLLSINNETLNSPNKNQKVIKESIQKYFLTKLMFQELTTKEKTDIRESLKLKLNEIIIANVLSSIINERIIIPSDDSIEKYYLQNKSRYKHSKLYHLSLLGLKLNKKNKLQVYQKAEKIHYEIVNNKLDFDAAINKYTQVKEYYKSGKTAVLSKQQISHAIGINVGKQIELMKVGDISKLVETDSGFLWIVRLDSITEPKQATLEEVREIVDKQLGKELIAEIEEDVSDEIIKKQNITFLN